MPHPFDHFFDLANMTLEGTDTVYNEFGLISKMKIHQGVLEIDADLSAAVPPYPIDGDLKYLLTREWINHQMHRYSVGLPLSTDEERKTFINTEAKIFFETVLKTEGEALKIASEKYDARCAAMSAKFRKIMDTAGARWYENQSLTEQLKTDAEGFDRKTGKKITRNVSPEFRAGVQGALYQYNGEEQFLHTVGNLLYGKRGGNPVSTDNDPDAKTPSKFHLQLIKDIYAGKVGDGLRRAKIEEGRLVQIDDVIENRFK